MGQQETNPQTNKSMAVNVIENQPLAAVAPVVAYVALFLFESCSMFSCHCFRLDLCVPVRWRVRDFGAREPTFRNFLFRP